MKQSVNLLLSACLFAAVLTNMSWANNNWFLPGDAFFSTEITKEDLEKLDDKNPVFAYSSLGDYEGRFSGNAGFSNLQIADCDEQFLSNLKLAYSVVRTSAFRELTEVIEPDGTVTLVERNGAKVLFYSKEFEFPKYVLGLRYNEKWAKEVVSFGFDREQIDICCFINTREAIMKSWRDSEAVPELPVKLPTGENRTKAGVDKPVLVSGPIKAIVLVDGEPLKDYANPASQYLTVLIVDSEGIQKLLLENGKWEQCSSDFED